MAEKLILVLDDDAPILEFLRLALEMDGYQVVTAGNGLEGLNRLTELQPGGVGGGKLPDLILCDVMMPGMDGVTFCRTLQAEPNYRAIPVVLLTAAATATYMDKCRYTSIIRKPFDLDQLTGVITELLQ